MSLPTSGNAMLDKWPAFSRMNQRQREVMLSFTPRERLMFIVGYYSGLNYMDPTTPNAIMAGTAEVCLCIAFNVSQAEFGAEMESVLSRMEKAKTQGGADVAPN